MRVYTAGGDVCAADVSFARLVWAGRSHILPLINTSRTQGAKDRWDLPASIAGSPLSLTPVIVNIGYGHWSA